MPDPARPVILIVDDEPSVAKVLGSLVQRAGYEVRTAGNPRDAMAILEEGVAAMLVDLRLPEMRGDAFYYLASARHPHLAERTILMTGDISEQAETLVMATGCPILRKPFAGSVLYALLGRMAPFTSSNSEAS
jgi:DNA-binding NtrC family response regulator